MRESENVYKKKSSFPPSQERKQLPRKPVLASRCCSAPRVRRCLRSWECRETTLVNAGKPLFPLRHETR